MMHYDSITMVMSTIQIRLTGEQIDVLRSMVGSGIYPSKSEAVRDAVRKYIRAFEQGLPIDQVETIEHEVQEEMKEMIQEEIKNYQNVKGTVDFYPEDKYIKEAVFTKLRDTAVRFNFNEIETPSFETLELLTAKSGEEIKTQIFTLEKRSTEQLGLRFDLTIPTTRLFIQKQKELPKPVKWFYIDRMWRYEKPQKGRLREFYQYGVEMYGSDKPEADAEVIALAIESLKNLGLTQKDIIVKINNRKLLEGLLLEIIPKEKMEAAKMLKTTVEKLVEDQNKKKEKPIYPTVSVKHSWCETDDSIIDYHPCFQFELEPGHITGIKDYLTIRKKGNHPSIQFNPNGKLINLGVAKFIYAPIFPWFFTKLRV